MIRLWRWFALVLVLLLVLSGCAAQPEFRGGALEPPAPAPEIALTDQFGRPFQLADHRGELLLVFFGFTSCPDICPTTLADVSLLRQRLGADAERVQAVYVTVDPDRDTAEDLADYVAFFDPDTIALRGPQSQLDPVMRDYGVTAIKREMPGSALGYTIDHSAFVYVIDGQGRLRLQFPFGMPVDDMVADVRLLLREG